MISTTIDLIKFDLACSQLESEKVRLSANKVRARMRSFSGPFNEPVGGQGQLQDLINERKGSSSLGSLESHPVPTELMVAISRCLMTAAAAAGQEHQAEIASLRLDCADLVTENRHLADRLPALESDLRLRTSERDAVGGEMKASRVEVAEVKNRLVGVEAALADAQILLAGTQSTVCDLKARADLVGQENLQLHTELQEVNTKLEESRSARVEADRRSKIAESMLEAEGRAKRDAEARSDALLESVHRIDAALARALSAEAANVELRLQIAALSSLDERRRHGRRPVLHGHSGRSPRRPLLR